MSQPDKKDENSPKLQDKHYGEANPMPDTHHVNPESESSPKPQDKYYAEANPMPDTHHVNPESENSPQKPGKDKK